MNLIQKAYIVPGQPHIYLAPERNPGWASLKQSYEAIGREIARSGAELMLVYSTQWFSVIGHLMQVDPQPKWVLVDQNWYEFGEIPYEFRIDPLFGRIYADICKEHGMQASTVAYHGFPIDTGTVVALKLLNPDNAVPASVVSCNIYAERDETRALGLAARAAIEQYGKKTVVVCVTNLSNRYEVAEIDPSRDRISSMKDDEWNRKVLEMLGEGRLEDVAQVAREFGREANADMGFKAIWWLGAVTGENNLYDGKVHDYQPVWGTGCAIVELTPAPSKTLDFEKEFDEAVPAFESGTGLETHNVLAEAPQVHDESGMSSQGEVIRTDKAPPPVGPYPHARRVGSLLFLSGIGPRKPGSGEIPGLIRDSAGSVIDHDIEIQTRATIENVRTILEEAGSSLEKVLDVTVYLTDMKRDFPRFNKIYGEYLGTVQPTRTTVGVDSLPTPIAVELKVIAGLLTDMIIDISPVIEPQISVWPGDTPFVQIVNLDMKTGSNITLSEVSTSVHVGAHTDAPSHFLADGDDIAARDLTPYIGRCRVIHVDVARGERIVPRHLNGKTIDAPRVLFRSGTFPDPRRWNDDFAALSPELAVELGARGVILAGIDTPSVDLFDSKELEAHHALARCDIAILEGIILDGVAEGEYELIALPLRIRGADASPVRAVLRTL